MPAVNELSETEKDVKIIWRAFELRVEPAPLPNATSERFKMMWEQSIYPLAAKLGVKMKMPTVKPYSRKTHMAARWANSINEFDEFKTAVFQAYFQQNKNIGELETLLSIAVDLSLDADALATSIKSNEFREAVLMDEQDAEVIGIRGVPAFVADRKSGLSGLQSIESLKQLINSVR